MANQILTPEQLTKAIAEAKAAEEAKNGPPAEGAQGSWALSDIVRAAPAGIRIGSGFLGATPWTGAAAGGIGETLAQLLESGIEGKNKFDSRKIIAETAVGGVGGRFAQSLGKSAKLAKPLISAITGGTINAAAPVIRHTIEEGPAGLDVTKYPGEIGTSAAIGAATAGAITGWQNRKANRTPPSGGDPIIPIQAGSAKLDVPLTTPDKPNLVKGTNALKVDPNQPVPVVKAAAQKARAESTVNTGDAGLVSNIDKSIQQAEDIAKAQRTVNDKSQKASVRREKAKGAWSPELQAELDAKAPILDLVEASRSRQLTVQEQAIVEAEKKAYPNGVVARAVKEAGVAGKAEGQADTLLGKERTDADRINQKVDKEAATAREKELAAQKVQEAIERQTAAGGTWREKPVSSSVSTKIDGENFSARQVIDPPPPPDAPDAGSGGGGGTGSGGGGPIAKSNQQAAPTFRARPFGPEEAPVPPVPYLPPRIGPGGPNDINLTKADVFPPDPPPAPVKPKAPKGPKGGGRGAAARAANPNNNPGTPITPEQAAELGIDDIQNAAREAERAAYNGPINQMMTEGTVNPDKIGSPPVVPVVDDAGRVLTGEGGYAGPERRGSGRNPGADAQYQAMRERVAQKNALAAERKKLPKAQPSTLTPEQREQVELMLREMEEMPPTPRTWHKDGSTHRLDNGTEIPFTPGAAGAPVYEALKGPYSNVSRADIIKQLKDLLAGKVAGRENATGLNAITEADRRLQRKNWRSAAADDAPSDPIRVDAAPDDAPDDAGLLDGLIAAAEKGGYRGNLDDLRVSLGERLALMAGDEGELSDAAGKLGPTWWDELDAAAPRVADDVVDVLPTGEAQPRLPEAGAVRDVENATPEMEVPFGLTPPVAKVKAGNTRDMFAEPTKPTFGKATEAPATDPIPEVPPAQAENLIPVDALRKSPLDVAGEHYSSVRQDRLAQGLKSRGNPLGDGERAAGTALDRMKKEAGIPVAPKQATPTPPVRTPNTTDNPLAKLLAESEANAPAPTRTPMRQVSPKATDPLSNLARMSEDELNALSPQDWQKAMDDIMIQSRKGERGEISPEMLARLTLGGFGAAAGAGLDDENRLRGAALGLGAGFMAPDGIRLAKGLIEKAQNSADPTVQAQAAEQVKSIFDKTLAILPDAYRAKLLLNLPNLPINAWVGPWGSAVMASLENVVAEGLTGNRGWGMDALTHLLNPMEFGRGVITSWPEASSRVEQAASRGEISTALDDVPHWIREIVSFPANVMTAGDISARNILMDSGATEQMARSATLTDEPSMGLLRAIRSTIQGGQTEGGKKSAAIRMMLPFHKTIGNQVEGGLERMPFGGGFLAQRAKDAVDRDPVNVQIAQNLLGTGVGMAAYQLGQEMPLGTTDTGNLTTNALVAKLLSNLGGQYGTIASAAFIAGQATQLGRDPIMSVLTSIDQALPLPTTPLDNVRQTYSDLTSPDSTKTKMDVAKEIALPQVVRDPANTDDLQEWARLLGF